MLLPCPEDMSCLLPLQERHQYHGLWEKCCFDHPSQLAQHLRLDILVRNNVGVDRRPGADDKGEDAASEKANGSTSIGTRNISFFVAGSVGGCNEVGTCNLFGEDCEREKGRVRSRVDPKAASGVKSQ